MDGVDYEAICKLAREEASAAVKRLVQDRMLQGEALDAEGLLTWGTGNFRNEEYENEVFGAFESYLHYIHYVIENTPVPLHV